MKRTPDQIIELIKQNESIPQWVSDAREHHSVLKALVYGENFKELLINRIEKIEESSRALARKKYSIDIRDLFARVLEPRNNIFFADGGSDTWDENTSKKTIEELKEYLNDFKNGVSIDDYIAQNLFRFSDIDPNGIIMMEYKNDERLEIYPTYKSINTIQNYESDGIKLKWVLFKKIVQTKLGQITKIRYIDSGTDATYIKKENQLTPLEYFTNEFGEVPAVILSNIQKVGSETRMSWVYFIEALAEKYARDRSVKTIYEFIQGFPKHWRYQASCNTCRGSGQIDGKTCKSCNGKGIMTSQDVTDDIMLPLPSDKDYDMVVAPNIAGFVSPDLATLKHMSEESKSLEDLIMFTMWGVEKQRNGGNETATGRFIDTQPLVNKLHVFADFAESVHNNLVHFTTKIVSRNSEKIYKKIYGRRFIIESPDVLMQKYTEARSKGASTIMLNKLEDEYISSKYKNDPIMRYNVMKRSKVEPYRHLTIDQINTFFDTKGVQEKLMFEDFWRDADKTKDVDILIKDFKEYVTNKNK